MKGTMKFAVLVGIASMLAIANPDKEDYLKHAAWNFQEKSCKQDPIALPAKVVCGTLGTLPPEIATQPLINSYSRRQNYVLFSLYTTDIWGMKTNTVAIAGHFFTL
ncbi:DUF4359 domain-containing protein [Spirulina sp. 06S082]|uniref:DUF4359 domain-containing protein n=1 Tax=Spirulina sp. 06S082 TaxID=3110248 RepID=UPI002B1ECF8B|nr:DUF4359 domain-containing protein [Spirulina sp. 06S082]MEA5467289.1 DUF4359 domain-containing protein [Spirulina sp. 06S082]